MTEVALRIAADAPEGGPAAPAKPREDGRDASGDPSPAWVRGVARLEGLVLLAALVWGGTQVHGAWAAGQSADTVVQGVRIAGVDAGGRGGDELLMVAENAGREAVQRAIVLRAGDASVETTAAELGAAAAIDRAVISALEVGRSGDPIDDLQARLAAASGGIDMPVSYSFDETAALEQLQVLAPSVESPSLPTRLDFEGRKVLEARSGTALLPYDSLSAVATGLASGAHEVELVVARKPGVEDPLGHLAGTLDISVVLGSFDTPYRSDEAHKDRTHNLKLGSTSIDGFVLQPGEEFSFNDTVGARSAENGYRYGTGISGGTLVDVLGGGICQVSSTMFGAGFFGGLEVVSARPHSRPSSYVDMGLDSTVVWPSVDMKLRNPYDFPVVLHMTVSSGKVHAEVLGPRRPYQISFERTLEESLPYPTVWRDDARYLTGSKSLAQRGRRGFKLKRKRKFLQAGEVVKTEDWDLRYPATTEIIRRGTNPAGELPEKKKLPGLRDPDPTLKIVQ
ncbi:MAG: VanW family protein [Nannocystaceae bacterium]|nr:VanW family protein [Nannocystaceae bacterium]